MIEKPTYEELEQRVLELEGREAYPNITELLVFPQLEKHSAVILIIDPDSGSIINANIAAENFYGYSIETLKQMKIQEINQLSPDKVAEKRREAANENINYFEFPHRLSSGEIRIVEVHSSPIVLHGKKLLLSIIHDITDRKMAEEALRESQALYQNLVESSQDLIWQCDSDGRYTYINPACETIFGYKVEKMLGKRFSEFQPPEYGERDQKTFDRLMQGNSVRDFETVHLGKDGCPIYLLFSATYLMDKHGNIAGTRGTAYDITKQKLAELALLKSEEKFRTLTEFSPIGVFLDDAQGNAIYINPRCAELIGVPANQGLNFDWVAYIHPDDRERVIAEWKRAFDNSDEFHQEYRWIHPDGKVVWTLGDIVPVRGDDGDAYLFIGTLTDITDRKRAEAEREGLQDQLRQAHKMEAIGTLAGGIAHEFNNMLGIILGNAELALNDIPEENPAADCIQEIRTASLRAKDVVKQLLSVSRKTPESRKPMRIQTIVDETLGLLRKTIPASIEIRSNLVCGTEMILADPTEISQVLMNLCSNSAHAMVDGKGVLEVTLETKRIHSRFSALWEDIDPGDYVRLAVSDDGAGIPTDILDRIFDPYFTTKDVDEGLGMGLAVVHGIVKKHDGAIKIESEVGKGTTAEVLFPLIGKQSLESAKNADSPLTGVERILFVDDESSLVKMATEMLDRSGYEVLGKTNSSDALKIFKENPERFDLVITDMGMADMAGDELAKQLIQIRPDIPIILCTGHSDRMDEKKAMELGIKAFAMKPLTKSDLAKTVRKVLDEKDG